MFKQGFPDKFAAKIIAAYEKLHSRGILHGNPSLYNMLLGESSPLSEEGYFKLI